MGRVTEMAGTNGTNGAGSDDKTPSSVMRPRSPGPCFSRVVTRRFFLFSLVLAVSGTLRVADSVMNGPVADLSYKTAMFARRAST
ncbi:MAG: hypothetical protein V2B18_03290 [Pseudomonadota bacterium]